MLDLTTDLHEKQTKHVRDASNVGEITIKCSTVGIEKLILKFAFLYLKDASSLLLFVFADSINGPTLLVCGVSELWADKTAALKQAHNLASASGN